LRGLSGRVAVITGAGQGLGQATALRFASEGCKVVVNDVKAEAAEQTVALIKQTGGAAAVSTHDISSHAKAEELFQFAHKTFGDLHILINNAGILRDAMLLKLQEKDFDAVIAVNLKGVFNCGQAAAKMWKELGHGGAMVNVSSIVYLGNVGQTNYVAAKAAVVGITKSWAMELARYQVRVNAIAPGLMATTMTEALPAQIKEQALLSIPLRRMGRPEEFASAAAFLASDEASYITGHILHFDGGSSLGGF
jgi:3-oxoacyl-[acyl-carrier protein] reductase